MSILSPLGSQYFLTCLEIVYCLSHARDQFRMRTLIFPSDSVHYRQRNIFRKKLKKFDPWSTEIELWYPGVV
jgi:hypothetical protein